MLEAQVNMFLEDYYKEKFQIWNPLYSKNEYTSIFSFGGISMKSGRKYLQFLKNSSFMKLYALVFSLAMQSPDWVGTSCINLFVTWIRFCVAPYCSGKENIWVGTPFGSCKLLFCDPILFHKLANVATHWKIDVVAELQIICFVKTHKLTHLRLILWGLHSFFSRK